MGTVKRHSECQPAHEECKGDSDDRHLPYEMDRNVDRKGSRWCVVRDARHTHKTPARRRLFHPKDSSVGTLRQRPTPRRKRGPRPSEVSAGQVRGRSPDSLELPQRFQRLKNSTTFRRPRSRKRDMHLHRVRERPAHATSCLPDPSSTDNRTARRRRGSFRNTGPGERWADHVSLDTWALSGRDSPQRRGIARGQGTTR